MANYYATARSSYFKVVDEKKFDEFCKFWGVTKIKKSVDQKSEPSWPEILYGFLCDQGDLKGAPPSKEFCNKCGGEINVFGSTCSCADAETTVVDFFDELVKHIAPEWVCIYQEVGSEKYRYIDGHSFAISSEGIIDHVNLNDIYKNLNGDDFNVTECLM